MNNFKNAHKNETLKMYLLSILKVARVYWVGFLAVAIIFSACSNELLDNPKSKTNNPPTKNTDADTNITEATEESNESIAESFVLTATHGQRRTITLNWTYQSDAYTYMIYQSKTPFAEDGEDTFTESMPQFYAKKTIQTKDKETGEEIKEIKSITTMTLDVDAGENQYYKMCSFNKNGEKLATSNTVLGTSLASPVLVFSERETSCDVQWFMDNCNNETYKKNVMFEVTCYNDYEGSDERETITVAGDDKNHYKENGYYATFGGLTNGNKYWYSVTAYLLTAAGDVEVTGPVDASTAKRMVPESVKLSASHGASTSAIDITWELPNFVYTKNKNDLAAKPLYFTVERADVTDTQNLTESDIPSISSSILNDKWVTVASYIGCKKAYVANSKPGDEDALQVKQYAFDCQKSQDGSAINAVNGNVYDCFTNDSNNSGQEAKCPLKVTRTKVEDPLKHVDSYKEYVVGSEITFSDKTGERGKKYLYRVTSYADDFDRVVTCDKNEINNNAALGYLICSANVTENATYTCDESVTENGGHPISNWLITLDLDFNDYGNQYNYLLVSQRTPYEDQSASGMGVSEKWQANFFSENGNEFKQILTSKIKYNTNKVLTTDAPCGEYKYKIFIMSPVTTESDVKDKYDETDSSNITFSDSSKFVYDIIELDNAVSVVPNTNALPQLHLFTIEDGYKDKFVFNFEYNEGYDYTLQYKNVKNGIATGDWVKSLEIANGATPPAACKINNDVTIKYKDAAGNEKSTVSKTITYNDSCENGAARQYQILAKSGVTMSKSPADTATGKTLKIAYALGLPKPTKVDKYYDSIKVVWGDVQKANIAITQKNNEEIVTSGFSVIAYYNDDTTKEDVAGSVKITKSTDKNGQTQYDAFIENVTRHDDPKWAGRPMTVEVSVTGEKKDSSGEFETLTGSCPAHLVGPALIDLQLITPTTNSMGIKWKPVSDADGYLIYRVGYTDIDSNPKNIRKFNDRKDTFTWYYDTHKTTILNGNNYDDAVSDNDKDNYHLYGGVKKGEGSDAGYLIFRNDYDAKENFEGSIASGNITVDYKVSYKESCMGLPYKYAVIPVLSNNNKPIGEFSAKDDVLTANVGFVYSSSPCVTTAMIGYGRDVRATKLDGGTGDNQGQCIDVTWQEPYWAAMGNNPNSSNLIPSTLFKDDTYKTPKITRTISKGVRTSALLDTRYNTSFTDTLAQEAVKKNISYEYYVTYNDKENDITNTYYEEYLKNNLEELGKEDSYDYKTNVTPEQKNIGYTALLDDNTIEMFNEDAREGNNYYTEKFAFKWNTSERLLTPKKIYFSIKNLNIDNSYHDVGYVDFSNANPNPVPTANTDVKIISNSGDVTTTTTSTDEGSTITNYVVRFAPSAIYDKNNGAKTTDGTGTTPNNGLLKVLRDYKHYYQVQASFKPKKSSDDIKSDARHSNKLTSGDEEFKGYRNITDEEFVRSATVIMGIGSDKSVPRHSWERSGGPKKNVNLANGDEGLSGTGSVESEFWVFQKDNYEARYSNYHLNIVTKAGVLAPTQFIINGTLKGRHTGTYASSHAPDEYYDSTISVKDVITDTVTTLTFNNLQWNSGSITCNGHAFGNITPFPFHDKNDNKWFVDKDEWK